MDLDELFPIPTLRFCKTHPNATLPKQSRAGDAGYDVFALDDYTLLPNEVRLFRTGVRISVPQGMAALVCPRSGLSAKSAITVHNGPGVIDANYTGELGVVLINNSRWPRHFREGDRIAQLVIVPVFDLECVELTADEFDKITTNRGTAGFGSSGR